MYQRTLSNKDRREITAYNNAEFTSKKAVVRTALLKVWNFLLTPVF